MRLANLGHDIYLGSCQACGSRPFELTIHFYRNSDLGKTCPTVQEGRDEGLRIYWREGEPLEAMSVPMATVEEYICRPGSLLIHCRHGITRSPLMAVAALTLRSGCDPWAAATTVGRAVYGYAGHAPVWPEKPWTDIVKYLEGN